MADQPVAPGKAPARDEDAPIVIAGHPLSRFYLRFHVGLILLWSFSVGVLASKLLLWLGLHALPWRYAITLLASYGAFFIGVRVWLAYVGADPFGGSSSNLTSSRKSGGSGNWDLGSWGGSGSGGSGPGIRGGGGDFAGAGASGSFAADAGDSDVAPSANLASFGSGPARTGSIFSFGSGGKGSGGGGGGSLDLGDDGWLIVLLLVVVAALLTSVFGAVIYLLHAAPTMLADVAFQAMLAGGLVRPSRRWRDASWEQQLFGSTWIPFTIVFLLALSAALLAAHLFPEARTMHEVLSLAWSRVG